MNIVKNHLTGNINIDTRVSFIDIFRLISCTDFPDPTLSDVTPKGDK